MATTGVLGWIARIAAVLVGVAFLLVTCVVSIPVFVLAYPVHVIRRRMRRPLTWIGSWITTVLAASVLMCVLIGFLLLHRDKTGATAWHTMTSTANQPQPDVPPPRILRYFPGATASYHAQPLSPGFASIALLFAFAIMAEMMGAIFGSLIWGGAWLVVSGWTGRLAGVPGK
jgi:hypothetical protein